MASHKPLRLLIVMPSWVGDAVMATPTLRMLRDGLRGSFIGGLMRPGIDEVMAGSPFFDQIHVERARGIMGPKLVANKVRPLQYDTAVLLTNSFSTALITRLAYIPRRIGYDRDGRGILLTQKLMPKRREGGRGFAPVPQVEYYVELARAVLGEDLPNGGRVPPMELGTTEAEERAAVEVLAKAGITGERPIAMLNPGGNNEAKRWPADRFAAVGAHLARDRGMDVVINGSPGEASLVEEIARRIRETVSAGAVVAELPRLGITLGALKAIVRRCSLMVTNDTGPRHIAAAMRVPTVALFGPTDVRWTALPPGTPEVCLVADPTLPSEEVADDHPERCRIDRITVEQVTAAVEQVLTVRR
jgi:heptosyltransferase-2